MAISGVGGGGSSLSVMDTVAVVSVGSTVYRAPSRTSTDKLPVPRSTYPGRQHAPGAARLAGYRLAWSVVQTMGRCFRGIGHLPSRELVI